MLLVTSAPDAGGAPLRLDPVDLILQASVPVKGVMLVLVGFSVASWVIVAAKGLHVRRAREESKAFLRAFDDAPSLTTLAEGGLTAFRGSPYARIFATTYNAWSKLTGGRRGPLDDARAVQVESIARRAASEEVTHLEGWMTLLGTIGSTSPFIGLFGTVYGIMDAFLGIGNLQNANLPVVAPKIAEALIATAVGLVAAIPAVMAYNYFGRRIQELADVMDGLAEDVAARARLGTPPELDAPATVPMGNR